MYFSADALWDTEDTYVTGGYWNEEPSLTAGASYSQTLSVGMRQSRPATIT